MCIITTTLQIFIVIANIAMLNIWQLLGRFLIWYEYKVYFFEKYNICTLLDKTVVGQKLFADDSYGIGYMQVQG